MAYFKLNQEDSEAKHIKYQDIPEYYTWDTSKHEWNKRKRQPKNMEVPRTIGRVSNVLPIQGEKFYLRLLLNHRTGATSFTDMKVLNGIEYSTYKDGFQVWIIWTDQSNISYHSPILPAIQAKNLIRYISCFHE